jgi:probable rRNA maturation factor
LAITRNSLYPGFSYSDFPRLKKFIELVINLESFISGEICIVFTTDEHILEMNREYLRHDYYTDVLTFDYCKGNTISGDIIVSIDRVLENSEKYSVKFAMNLTGLYCTVFYIFLVIMILPLSKLKRCGQRNLIIWNCAET